MGNAIEVERVSKRYRLGVTTREDLRERITSGLSRALRRSPAHPASDFWALHDVSFSVEEGSALGLIGRNGAGKSTMLKLLARITEPTSGRCRTRGRVGSLLEVGTGFHGELTGRENIFLNGAILGMPRRSVAGKLDEIVDFAGVGQFLDTPVKRYSSGMFLRLAFAVAAHLDSAILVVDEVLAVGDAEFQRRCMQRMSEVGAQGRTIVFVSHDLNAVTTLCDRVLWLERGVIVADGPGRDVVTGYLRSTDTSARGGRDWTSAGSDVELEALEVRSVTPGSRTQDRADPVCVWFRYRADRAVRPFYACISISDASGRLLIEEQLPVSAQLEPGIVEGSMVLPPLLNVGTYAVSWWAGNHFEDYVTADQAVSFDVVGDDEGLPKPPIRVKPQWCIRDLP